MRHKQVVHKCLFTNKYMKRLERNIGALSTYITITGDLEADLWSELFIWIIEGTLQFMLPVLLSTKDIRILF